MTLYKHLMTKYFATFLLLLLPLTLTQAQRFKGGPLLGLSAAQIDGDYLSGYNKAGLVAGAFVRTELFRDAGMQMEIKYIGKGAAKPRTDENDLEIDKTRLDYIEVPVLFFLNTGIENFYFEGGLIPAYLMQARRDDGNGFLKPEEPYNSLDLSGAAGLRYDIFQKLSVNVRFSYSIVPILDHPGGQSWRFNQGVYNNVFSFAIYYTF